MKRTSLLAAVSVAIVTAVVGIGAATAKADYRPLAEYQVAVSFNCNNAAECAPDLGGFWGWAVFNTDGSADAELTGCGHLQGGPGGGGGGAGHMHVDVPPNSWYVGENGDFWVVDETDTATGHGQPVTTTTPGPQDTGIPAEPGHYSTSDLLGFSPLPGVSFQIQVTEIPNR